METPTWTTLDGAIERSKQEILSDMKEGIIPRDCSEFEALHTYIDANEYGGATEHDFDESHIEFWNAVQAEVDGWLKQRVNAQIIQAMNVRTELKARGIPATSGDPEYIHISMQGECEIHINPNYVDGWVYELVEDGACTYRVTITSTDVKQIVDAIESEYWESL